MGVVFSENDAIKSLERNKHLLKSLARTGDINFVLNKGSSQAEDISGSVSYAVPDDNYDIQIFLQLKVGLSDILFYPYFW